MWGNGIVRAELAGPVAIDRYMTLDGLLFATIIREPDLRAEMRQRRFVHRLRCDRGEEGMRQYLQERGWEMPPYTHALPLAAWGHGKISGIFVYAASYAVPDEPCEYDTVHWARRADSLQMMDWVGDLPQKVQIGKGPYRNCYMPLQLVVTYGLTWHVRGELDEIRRILERVRYFGKKRAQGHGRVRRWIVEECAENKAIWDGNELRRPVPKELLEAMRIEGEFEYGYYAFRPPYHDSRNFTLCAMSGRRKRRPCGGEREVSENSLDVEQLLAAFGH
jgi:hypothetical protein